MLLINVELRMIFLWTNYTISFLQPTCLQVQSLEILIYSANEKLDFVDYTMRGCKVDNARWRTARLKDNPTGGS